LTYDTSNIFAKIIRGEAPCFRVYEDDATLAFLDIMPQAEGHTLVIPKEHAESIFDLSPGAASSLIRTTQRVASAVKDVTGSSGILLAQLNGAAAGQTVFHIHFHIIPRAGGIDLNLHARDKADFEKLKSLAAKIAAAVRQE
jgi:histidine triad (HIT) family protein